MCIVFFLVLSNVFVARSNREHNPSVVSIVCVCVCVCGGGGGGREGVVCVVHKGCLLNIIY